MRRVSGRAMVRHRDIRARSGRGGTALWRRITARERGNCESAGRQGVRDRANQASVAARAQPLSKLYDPWPVSAGSSVSVQEFVNAISGSESFTLARCLDTAGRTAIANRVYCAHDQGYFLASARAAETPAGAGRLVHWEVASSSKVERYRFYDLGLVASLDRADGISSFKRSLGGSVRLIGSRVRMGVAVTCALVKLFELRRMASCESLDLRSTRVVAERSGLGAARSREALLSHRRAGHGGEEVYSTLLRDQPRKDSAAVPRSTSIPPARSPAAECCRRSR